MTIYNTYRPHTFDDVIGQKHIIQTLKNAIDRNIVGHAYLFTGPRGTGKTTLGRIFAHAVNCTPRKDFTPSDEHVCAEILAGNALDVIEIDAASHTSVENIRDLRETVAMPPSRAHYKVYIIDEAHMLSTAAWNAFLKTLEEPPAHAIFLFATTEVHKVPETILSRVQRFDLNRIAIDDISKKLLRIAQAEEIALDTDSVAMIAIASGGSMRDAESLLAQVIAFTSTTITPADVRTILGITQRSTTFALIEQIIARTTADALTTLSDVVDAGHNLSVFSTSLLTILRHALLGSVDTKLLTQIQHQYDETEQLRLKTIANTPSSRIITIIDALITARTTISQSAIPQLPLEIAIVRLTANISSTNTDTPHKKTPAIAPTPTHKKTPAKISAQIISSKNLAENPLQSLTNIWPDIIKLVKKDNVAFAALLRHSAPHTVTADTLTLVTTNALLIEKLTDNTLRLTLQGAIVTICGKRFIIAHVVDDTPSSSVIANAMQVMNGGCIIENA